MGIFYINTNALNQSQIRVVAIVWLQKLLESLGFGGKFARVSPPLAVVVILIALQITSGKQWRFWPGDILPMTIECVLFAVPLIILTLSLCILAESRGNIDKFDDSAIRNQAGLQTYCSSITDNSISSLNDGIGRNGSSGSLLANIITGIGAGIYEELVFRLVLICVLMMLFQDVLRFTTENSILFSVLISAALFSALYHIDFFSGQPNAITPFNLTRIALLTLKGVYFAVLFAIRGFGITAGTHVSYNTISVLLSCKTCIIPLV